MNCSPELSRKYIRNGLSKEELNLFEAYIEEGKTRLGFHRIDAISTAPFDTSKGLSENWWQEALSIQQELSRLDALEPR